ncbi:efflux RND transporter periplasmic adaptor subunit [Sulfurimonas sp.]
MNKYIKIAIGAVVVVAVVVVGVKKVQDARAQDANLPQGKIYPIVVSIMSPTIALRKLTLPYLAEVANDKDVKLSARIAARVQMIQPSGSSVKKGDVLVRLDTTTIKSSLLSAQEQIQAAKIALKNLEATHKRTLELLKVHGVSIEESQKETTMIANTQAQLNALKQKEIELKNNLSYATILSPVNGVIAKTFVNQGSISAPAKPLVAISSKNGFYLMVRVPTTLPIEGVEFQGNFYPATALNTTYHGLAEYKVYTGSANLISGDKVEVDVVVFNHKAILLPFDAILSRDNKSYVLIVQNNSATTQEVHIIQSAQQGVIISDNLVGKKIVVAKPDILLKLTSGHTLKVKE